MKGQDQSCTFLRDPSNHPENRMFSFRGIPSESDRNDAHAVYNDNVSQLTEEQTWESRRARTMNGEASTNDQSNENNSGEETSLETLSQYADASETIEFAVGLQEAVAEDFAAPLLPNSHEQRDPGCVRCMLPFEISERASPALWSVLSNRPSCATSQEARKWAAIAIFIGILLTATITVSTTVLSELIGTANKQGIISRGDHPRKNRSSSQEPTPSPFLPPSVIPTPSPSCCTTTAPTVPTPPSPLTPAPVPSTPTASPGEQRLEQILHCALRFSGVEITKGDPVRWTAVQYLAEGGGMLIDTRDCEDPKSFFIVVYSLIVIRESFGISDPTWNKSVTDLSMVCRWSHIKCSRDSGSPDISELSLGHAKLSGTIPPEIKGLYGFEYLFLYSNPDLKGALPSGLGLLSNLQDVQVHYSGITGTVPSTLGNLHSLKQFRLYDTNLSGTMPDEVCYLVTKVKTLNVWFANCVFVECSCCTKCRN